MNDWMSDTFTKDFQLVISSSNGFRKEFPLKKNVGLNGWELSLTKEDLNSFPKINMTLDSIITGKRGFNEIKSPKFDLPIPIGSSWEINPDSQKGFAVGGKRVITLKNPLGNCKCLQTVVYKPSFGGQFIFEVNNPENGLNFSPDGKEVSFEVDTTNFQPGQGQLELRQFGGEATNLNIKLYPAPPNVMDVKMARGDSRAIIYGEKLDQLKAVRINGRRARVVEKTIGSQNNSTSNNEQNAPGTFPTNNPSQNEVTVAFEDAAARQESNNITLELELEDNRIYQYPRPFNVSLARPAIVANEAGEIEGTAIKNNSLTSASSVNLAKLPVFPIETSEVDVIVQNTLTDYDFKAENIQIETRIENAQLIQNELPDINFEVLDWKNIKIGFPVNDSIRRLLGGRRLQFRIRDKQRGDSNWYTIKQTFTRVPKIAAVKCQNGVKGNCEISGEGIEYISQVSVDGGKTWFPEQPASLAVQPAPDGRKVDAIPYVGNRKLLKVRLRDFPIMEGLPIN
jgi:hypothetical protein